MASENKNSSVSNKLLEMMVSIELNSTQSIFRQPRIGESRYHFSGTFPHRQCGLLPRWHSSPQAATEANMTRKKKEEAKMRRKIQMYRNKTIIPKHLQSTAKQSSTKDSIIFGTRTNCGG